MNYIQQVNEFWERVEECDITGNDIAIYLGLLDYCNRLKWLNPFICHWDIVCQKTKVSKNTYYKSLGILQLNGFITYESGIKNSKKPKVFILEFENRKGTVVGTEKEQHKEQNEEQKGNLYKQQTINKEQETIPTQSEIHPMQVWINGQGYSNVSKMKSQLTYENCESLLEKYPKELIKEKLGAMENKPNLCKEYSSVYLTLSNWCSKSAGNTKPKSKNYNPENP